VAANSRGVAAGGHTAKEWPSLVMIPPSDTGTIEMDKEYGGPGEIRTPDPRHVKAH